MATGDYITVKEIAGQVKFEYTGGDSEGRGRQKGRNGCPAVRRQPVSHSLRGAACHFGLLPIPEMTSWTGIQGRHDGCDAGQRPGGS
jgi:hypothetical protein